MTHMLTKKEKQFSVLFFIIVLIELVTGSFETLQYSHFIAKPAIVISLIFLFINTGKHLSKSIFNKTLAALIFSLLGDILLMFVHTSPHFFTVGLVAFLIAHVFYILAFMPHKNSKKSPLGFIIGLIVYAVFLFYILRDGLGSMLIPVIIYMLVILTMATTAYLRKNSVSELSYKLVFVGAIMFMISDSILAINKFHEPLPISNISIMITYALAQYLIVLGILKISVTNSKV
jgi:uncharacterized membrane protein YhhN